MSHTWAWIGRRRERGVIAMCIEHLDRVIKVAELFNDMVNKYFEESYEDVKKYYLAIFDAEKEADDAKRNIIAELSRGMFHPVDREELIRLVLTADDIAAYIKAAARKLLLLMSARLPKELLNHCMTMSSKIVNACKLIKDAVINLADDPRKSLELADRVERIEEEIDDIRMKALKIFLTACREFNISTCIMIKDFIDDVENASDKCEDVADVIRSIAILTL